MGVSKMTPFARFRSMLHQAMMQHPRAMVSLVALLSAGSWLLAQYAVNMQSPAPPISSGSIRYAPGFQTRALPSESRYATMRSGLLPSENRNLNFLSGTLPSQGRNAYLTQTSPRYSGSYTPSYGAGGSFRYGSSPAYSMGSAYGIAARSSPYQASMMRPVGSMSGTGSMLRPVPSYTSGSLRYAGR